MNGRVPSSQRPERMMGMSLGLKRLYCTSSSSGDISLKPTQINLLQGWGGNFYLNKNPPQLSRYLRFDSQKTQENWHKHLNQQCERSSSCPWTQHVRCVSVIRVSEEDYSKRPASLKSLLMGARADKYLRLLQSNSTWVRTLIVPSTADKSRCWRGFFFKAVEKRLKSMWMCRAANRNKKRLHHHFWLLQTHWGNWRSCRRRRRRRDFEFQIQSAFFNKANHSGLSCFYKHGGKHQSENNGLKP